MRLLFSLSCWRLDNRPMEDEIDEVIALKAKFRICILESPQMEDGMEPARKLFWR